LYSFIVKYFESGKYGRGIEVAIAFVIGAISLLTGIILYGYSPGITNSEGQLVINETGITGIALVIVGLFVFGLAVFTLTTKTLD